MPPEHCCHQLYQYRHGQTFNLIREGETSEWHSSAAGGGARAQARQGLVLVPDDIQVEGALDLLAVVGPVDGVARGVLHVGDEHLVGQLRVDLRPRIVVPCKVSLDLSAY